MPGAPVNAPPKSTMNVCRAIAEGQIRRAPIRNSQSISLGEVAKEVALSGSGRTRVIVRNEPQQSQPPPVLPVRRRTGRREDDDVIDTVPPSEPPLGPMLKPRRTGLGTAGL